MNATSQTSDATGRQFDPVLDRLTAQIRLRIPALHCRIHHGANDHFAWWVVARLSNPSDETKIVDISIECRLAGSNTDIHVDLAREDGTVLQEMLAEDLAAPPRGFDSGALAGNAIQRVENFLLGHVECLVGELL